MIRQNPLLITLLFSLVGIGFYILIRMPPTAATAPIPFVAETPYAPVWPPAADWPADDPGLKKVARPVVILCPTIRLVTAGGPRPLPLIFRPTFPPKPIE